jgi:hypothetical protein
MYQAKLAGKNRVCSAEGEDESEAFSQSSSMAAAK